MRKITIAALGLLAMFSLWVGTAVGAGLPMLSPGVESADTLARKFELSLTEDPAGNAVLPGSMCTTPAHFYNAIREMHPDAKLNSIAELPAYVRSLQRRPQQGDTQVYKMSRILHRISQGKDKCKLDLEGWTRSFRNGEYAFWDPNLGRPILAGDCTNVVGRQFESTPVKMATADPFFLRVRFWEWGTIPRDIQKRIVEILEKEDDSTYLIQPSVSRNIGPILAKRSKETNRQITTVNKPVQAIIYHPMMPDGKVFWSKPGDHPGFPNLVYWETTLLRSDVARMGLQFGVIPVAPDGCTVVYPRQGHWLDTMPDELLKLVTAKNQDGTWRWRGANLNPVINCTGPSDILAGARFPSGW